MPDRRDLVVNTGPLLALAAAGYLDLLSKLFSRVIVPFEVAGEIEAGGSARLACDEFRAAAWLDKRQHTTPLPVFLRATLDAGEAAVIALGLSEGVRTVCIDESLGRNVARLHGLSVTGSLGVLLRAKQDGMGVEMRTAIARMRTHGIWLSAALERECLRIAGE